MSQFKVQNLVLWLVCYSHARKTFLVLFCSSESAILQPKRVWWGGGYAYTYRYIILFSKCYFKKNHRCWKNHRYMDDVPCSIFLWYTTYDIYMYTVTGISLDRFSRGKSMSRLIPVSISSTPLTLRYLANVASRRTLLLLSWGGGGKCVKYSDGISLDRFALWFPSYKKPVTRAYVNSPDIPHRSVYVRYCHKRYHPRLEKSEIKI